MLQAYREHDLQLVINIIRDLEDSGKKMTPQKGFPHIVLIQMFHYVIRIPRVPGTKIKKNGKFAVSGLKLFFKLPTPNHSPRFPNTSSTHFLLRCRGVSSERWGVW